jgi:photosystem II stability/assembly factor-like uncharacterized protein
VNRANRATRIVIALATGMLAVAVLTSGGGGTRHAESALPAPGGTLGRFDSDPDAQGVTATTFDDVQQGEWALPAPVVPLGAYRRGLAQAADVSPLPPTGNQWQELGPRGVADAGEPNRANGARSTISGRLTALAIDPATCSGTVCGTIYAGAAGGGVWKTTDAGRTWVPILDDQPNLQIGALTLDPADPSIIYAGTGDPSHAGRSGGGIGLLRSLDGGRTWTVLGGPEFSNRSITAVLVDPRTAGSANARLYVATTYGVNGASSTDGGSAASPPTLPRRGVYVSFDGGLTWTFSQPRGVPAYGADSLAIDPRNPDILYAGFAYEGVYRSADAGRSWQRLSGGLPKSLTFGDLRVSLDAGSPRVLYAAFNLLRRRSHEAMYRSTDGGTTWTHLPHMPDACGSQCRDNLSVVIDPSDPNTVYAGGTANYDFLEFVHSCERLSPLPVKCSATLVRSTDGGKTWADMAENGGRSPVHPDTHAVLIDPRNPAVLYVAGDGGLFHSANRGRTWDDLNRGLGTLQFIGLSVGPDGTIYGGTQDNGTFRYDPGSATWTQIDGGDGGLTGVNPKDPSMVYTSHYGSSLHRTLRVWGPYRYLYVAAFHHDFDRNLGNFYEPFALAPSAPQDIIYGTYRIWRSKLGGGVDGNYDGITFGSPKDRDDWVPISFDLSCGRQPAKPSHICDHGEPDFNGVGALAISPIDPNVVVAANWNGHVWLTRNALHAVKTDRPCTPSHDLRLIVRCNFVSGVRWTRIDRGLPNRFPTAITFFPGSSTRILISYSGFDETRPAHPGHIFFTADAGATWQNLTGTVPGQALPDLPFTDVIVNPASGHLYASADIGTFVSTDSGTTWRRADVGLPASPVFQMQIDPTTGKLVVATYGRGIWQIAAP